MNSATDEFETSIAAARVYASANENLEAVCENLVLHLTENESISLFDTIVQQIISKDQEE